MSFHFSTNVGSLKSYISGHIYIIFLLFLYLCRGSLELLLKLFSLGSIFGSIEYFLSPKLNVKNSSIGNNSLKVALKVSFSKILQLIKLESLRKNDRNSRSLQNREHLREGPKYNLQSNILLLQPLNVRL